MRVPRGALLWSVLGLGIAGSAMAQSSGNAGAGHIYTCKDASGRMITSDQPIPECANRNQEERSKGGIILREIPPPLTAAQRAQAEADEKKRRAEEAEKLEQQRRDRVLLSTYSSEQDIQGARNRALGDFKDALDAANGRLAGLNQEHAANAREAETYKGKTLPAALQRKIDLNESAIANEMHTITDRQGDIDRINQRFDVELSRFRELTKDVPKDK
jgi:hypothetical protein